jgi:hypothetical protein
MGCDSPLPYPSPTLPAVEPSVVHEVVISPENPGIHVHSAVGDGKMPVAGCNRRLLGEVSVGVNEWKGGEVWE